MWPLPALLLAYGFQLSAWHCPLLKAYVGRQLVAIGGLVVELAAQRARHPIHG